MALEAVVFQQDLFGCTSSNSGKDLYNLVGGNWGLEKKLEADEKGSSFDEVLGCTQKATSNCNPHYYYYGNWNSSLSMLDNLYHLNSSFPDANGSIRTGKSPPLPEGPLTALARPKRRRVKCQKNKEDVENQRMTHIAVERNRRKQMNQYLSLLRSVMPDSYVQRGDQASIIGGAINFVKELEQRLQFLGTQKKKKKRETDEDNSTTAPFSEFFTFPQYSTAVVEQPPSGSSSSSTTIAAHTSDSGVGSGGGGADIIGPADVEVTMVERHASIKIRIRRRRKQLLRMVSEMHTLRLTILHLNVTTTLHHTVLFSLSVKVEDGCRLNSVDEIATAVHELFGRIQEEATLNI